MNMSLNCEVVRDLVSLYKDESASPVTVKEIKEHLQECSACTAYYKEYANTVKSARLVQKQHGRHKFEVTDKYRELAKRMRTREQTETAAMIAGCVIGLLCTLAAIKELSEITK